MRQSSGQPGYVPWLKTRALHSQSHQSASILTVPLQLASPSCCFRSVRLSVPQRASEIVLGSEPRPYLSAAGIQESWRQLWLCNHKMKHIFVFVKVKRDWMNQMTLNEKAKKLINKIMLITVPFKRAHIPLVCNCYNKTAETLDQQFVLNKIQRFGKLFTVWRTF